jgi:hypothetical protein
MKAIKVPPKSKDNNGCKRAAGVSKYLQKVTLCGQQKNGLHTYARKCRANEK